MKRYTAKFSEDKVTLPGAKQIFRYPDRDVIGCAAEFPKTNGADALIRPVIYGGRIIEPLPGVTAARAHAAASLARLPETLLIEYSEKLKALVELVRRDVSARVEGSRA